MADIHKIHKRDMPDSLAELMDVLKRHNGTITQDDAINILGNLSMVFMGQDSTRAAELLHETFLSLTAFYDLPIVMERDRHGQGVVKVAASKPSKPK